ncbi:MAG: alanine dehydrogenase [Gammaproteobacteria bacterium]|nr:MAG: alanine dehydrogenase [Gammaproteobacteria bacterium]RTZ76117.1 MAG: alanine dehydrogenase [Gammaproteobacteria bacterium]
MQIGIPKEIKPLEGRVALVPEAAAELVAQGHRVLLQAGAGEASGYPDEAYRRHGVAIVADAEALYAGARLIVKVKEPVGPELGLLRDDHLLFSFLHLAAEPELIRRLCEIGLTAIGFETVEVNGSLPILAPMSNIAGRIAVQWGARLLGRPAGGKGILLGGVATTGRGRVVVIGAGHAGGNAVRIAADLGAQVTVFDRKPEKLETMMAVAPNITARYPYASAVADAVASADLLVGAVLVPGARAPRVVGRELVAAMEAGSVIVDIAVDQGGCVETTRPTTWKAPVFEAEGVLHFGVTNMPGAVPRTASIALSASLMPWVQRLAQPDWQKDDVLLAAVNVRSGRVVHPALL